MSISTFGLGDKSLNLLFLLAFQSINTTAGLAKAVTTIHKGAK